jgi:putative transposase
VDCFPDAWCCDWEVGGYREPKLAKEFQKIASWKLENMKRNDEASGFEALPRRWVVECTFTWLGKIDD